MLRCLYHDSYNLYRRLDGEEVHPLCQNEAKYLDCGFTDCIVCEDHRCRCKIKIVECEHLCLVPIEDCPDCKGKGWYRSI